MKKFIYILILFVVLGAIAFSIFYLDKNDTAKSEQNNIDVQKTSYEENISTNSNTDNNEYTEVPVPTLPVEEDLASFSTKIYTKNDSSRQKNMEITSSKLNETIVEAGQTFSFTSTVGKASPEEGYEKADIYDKDGNKIKGYGGGNCQISSTLYNVVLQIPSLSITERHPHSKKVPYVEKGKDAAVAYGSIDFKFTNTNDFSIKIYCTVDKENVTARIVKLN